MLDSNIVYICFLQINNLPKPYRAACQDLQIRGFAKYTKSACLLLCRARFVISRCKCSSYDLRGLEGTIIYTIFVKYDVKKAIY